jgi:nucleotide-binding universal stress UspA family protein
VKPKPVLVEKFGGLVADVIIAQARKQRAGLIVLGTHGRRGVTRLVMGSDAEGVVRRTPVPVLLVRK